MNQKYETVGDDVKKERVEVHSVQGPLRIETNACEADPTFILHHFLLKNPNSRSRNEGRSMEN